MPLIDLSHAFSPGMPVFPGSESPGFEQVATLSEQGYREKRITFFSHTGTHIDAPAHVLERGKTLDLFSPDDFWGEAAVIRAAAVEEPFQDGMAVGVNCLEPYQEQIGKVRFVLLCTGWDRFWGKSSYFSGYPVMTQEAAAWLARFPLSGIGIDAISIDRPSEDLANHAIFAARGLLLVENLTRLGALPASGFTFFCLPLNITEGDGAPVRAAALVPE